MFDYIIVGAGSAGCVLANRLSANPNNSVLLLEAGKPDKKLEINIPAAFQKLFKTEFDWEYYTEPQAHVDNRKMYWPRGKTLGGSSSINAMIYIRGHQRDYEHWAALGNEEWGWDDVLPYFKKAENNERGGDSLHGVGGPLNVADLRQINPLSEAFVSAATGLGIRPNPDFNGPNQAGVGFYQVTQKDGKRMSTARAYLKPVLKRPNLTAETEAIATKVTFEGKRATGIAYQHKGQMKHASARREVILCGGAINSPHLLLLSGVGGGEQLQQHGIPIVMDLPGVGRNLQDHLAIGAGFFIEEPVSFASAETIPNLLRYLLLGRGMLTSCVAEGGAFIRSRPDIEHPDLQFHFGSVLYLSHGFGEYSTTDRHGFSVGPCLLRPKSRGEITLHSNNPFEKAKIQPNYLSHPDDMEALLVGLKLAINIGESQQFARFKPTIYKLTPDKRDDESLRAFTRQHIETLYHPVGTCKMGVDPMAVVDPQLRVHGVEGLRVVDASVMPTVVSGNTNAPTIMIGEKAADYILQ